MPTPNQPTSSSKNTKRPQAKSNVAVPRAQVAGSKSKPPKEFRGEAERKRKLIVERTILACTVAFCFLLIFSVWWTRGKVLDSSVRFLARFAGVDAMSPRVAAMNCRHPKNENTPYCIEHRAETDANWQSMSRNQGGKTNAFSLHNN